MPLGLGLKQQVGAHDTPITAQFSSPMSLTYGDRHLWSCDKDNAIIQKLNTHLPTPSAVALINLSSFGISWVREVRYDSFSGYLFACGMTNGSDGQVNGLVIINTRSNKVIGLLNFPGIRGPRSVTFKDGYVFVTASNAGTSSTVYRILIKDIVEAFPNPILFSFQNPSIIATGQADPFDIAADGYNVYWTNNNNGGTGSVAIKLLNANNTLLINNLDNPHGITIDSDNVYWAETDTSSGYIKQVSKFISPVKLADNRDNPFPLIGDAFNLYWTESVFPFTTFNVFSMSKNGGTPSLISTSSDIRMMVTDGVNIYYYNSNDLFFYSVPIGGGSTTPIGTIANNSADSLVTDGTNIYWIDIVSGSLPGDPIFINSRPIGGGSIIPVVSGFSLTGTICKNIIVDSTFLYFFMGNSTNASSNCAIYKVNKSGGSPSALASSLNLLLPNSFMPMVVDSTNVYWMETTNTGIDTNDGTIKFVPITGGSVTTLTASPDPSLPIGFTPTFLNFQLDNGKLYWSEVRTSDSIHYTYSINYMSTGGGTVFQQEIGDNTVDNTVRPQFMVISGNFAYASDANSDIFKMAVSDPIIISSGGNPWDIVVDSTSVYWTDTINGTVSTVPIGGGTTVHLATGLTSPVGISIDGTHIYWTDSVDGTITRLLKSGGSPSILASSQNQPWDIVVSDGVVYWTNHGDNSIVSVSTSGGSTTTFASGLSGALGIAADAINIYWTTESDSKIQGIPKTKPGSSVTTLSSDTGSANYLALGVNADLYWTNSVNGTIDKINVGTLLDAASVSIGAYLEELTFGSNYVWGGTGTNFNGLYRIDPSSMSVTSQPHADSNVYNAYYAFGSVWSATQNGAVILRWDPNTWPSDPVEIVDGGGHANDLLGEFASDGASLWFTDSSTGNSYIYRLSTGIGTENFVAHVLDLGNDGNERLDGCAFDGNSIWVTSRNGAAPSTTIASGSNGLSLPQTDIFVNDTTGFNSNGTIIIKTNAGPQIVFYTGIAAGPNFTGCTGGTGVMITGDSVFSGSAPGVIRCSTGTGTEAINFRIVNGQ